MSAVENGANGDWRAANRADVYFTDQEIFLLSHCDATWFVDYRISVNSLGEDEMRCQRDMIIRGKRLWNYHERVGDLSDFLPERLAA